MIFSYLTKDNPNLFWSDGDYHETDESICFLSRYYPSGYYGGNIRYGYLHIQDEWEGSSEEKEIHLRNWVGI